MGEPKICRRCHQRVMGIEASAAGKLGAARAHLETAQRYLQAHPSQASAHDLQAANAELRARAEKAEAERDEARDAVAWANNSLYGSHSFFLSSMGGPPNPHHLDKPIEELKARSNGQWHRAETAIRERDEARQLAAGAAEKGWRTFWKAFGDHLHLQSEQRVYGWHDLMNACEKGMDAVKAALANGAP